MNRRKKKGVGGRSPRIDIERKRKRERERERVREKKQKQKKTSELKEVCLDYFF